MKRHKGKVIGRDSVETYGEVIRRGSVETYGEMIERASGETYRGGDRKG